MFRLARRITSLALLAVVVYLGVTFAQVWSTARKDQAREADAIVVLGAAQYNGRPSPVLRARLDHAAKLYERDLAATIVVTGGKAETDSSTNTEASASATYLAKEHGIAGKETVLWENAGCNTWDSMASTANELRKRGKSRVLLVSDPFHSARIAAIAEELDLDARVSPTRSSPIGGSAELKFMARETAVIAAGRVIGFRRLMGIDELRRNDGGDCG
ncbi:MAG TPA: YdcF family protein [Acidimicrobiales bacterium]